MIGEQLNTLAGKLCEATARDCERLDIEVVRFDDGGTVLDFGANRTGTIAGGIRLAEICLSGLGDVRLETSQLPDYSLPALRVTIDHPLAACIASQYAGWPFSTESFFSMCSGPARLARGREEILSEYNLASSESTVVGIFEASQLPGQQDLIEFAEQCQRNVRDVTVCLAKTSSLPGTLQVVARSVETAMHKLHEIGFDLTRVLRAVGVAPIPPIGDDDYQSMGWTNDAILYGADVTLWLERVDDLYALVDQLPSCSSSEFGRPFIEIFEKYDRNFYRVDRMLFSPARVNLNCLETGKVVTGGQLRMDLLRSSFGLES